MQYRTYVNGKLKKRTTVTLEQGQRYLDNAEKEWGEELWTEDDLTKFGSDPNMGMKVTRTERTVEVLTTGKNTLRFELVD